LDYGTSTDPFANVRRSEDLGIPGWCGAVLRNNDKQIRLQKAVRDTIERGTPVLANEGVKDSLLDQAVYALIGYVLYEDWEASQEKKPIEEGQTHPSTPEDLSDWLNDILTAPVGPPPPFVSEPKEWRVLGVDEAVKLLTDRSTEIFTGDLVKITSGARTGEYAFVANVNPSDGMLFLTNGPTGIPQSYYKEEVELVG
jgi:hypothetical protein